jgi:hypothetical protein
MAARISLIARPKASEAWAPASVSSRSRAFELGGQVGAVLVDQAAGLRAGFLQPRRQPLLQHVDGAFQPPRRDLESALAGAHPVPPQATHPLYACEVSLRKSGASLTRPPPRARPRQLHKSGA